MDDEGHFLWPGFGENLRVLLWILKRCEDKVGAVETPIGYLPKPEDINLEGIDVTKETLKELLSVDKDLWLEDTVRIEEFYNKIGDTVPKELWNELAKLKKNLT